MNRQNWKYVLVPVIAIVFLAIYPQLSSWVFQRVAWQGSYQVSNYDEVAYSAYINALINGAPRKNDPFVGLSDSPETPQPETLYSIQFIPAYAIALPARLLGLSAAWTFIGLSVLIAVFSTIAVWWLLYDLTENPLVSAVGVMVVLCFGTAAAFAGELRLLLTGGLLADYLPFLRRYQPGFAFPLFFVFCVFLRRAFRAENAKRIVAYSAAAGAIFALLVYSYFYLWTAAAAFAACYAIANAVMNRDSLKRVATASVTFGSIAIVTLIPYSYVLSLRSHNLDSVQLLAATRMPQFASPTVIIGAIVAAIAIFAIGSRKAPAVFAVALSLTPIILFNQQVVTGHSLQPVHYDLFIANYMVMIAAVVTVWMIVTRKETPVNTRWVIYIGIAAFFWGFYEAAASTGRNAIASDIRDASVPAVLYAAASTGKGEAVLATNFITADYIPTVAPVRSLWNPHTSSAGGVDLAENRRLFYLHLYFSGFSDADLCTALRRKSFEATAALFGSERALPELGGGAPVTTPEIDAECAKFSAFARNMNEHDAYSPTLSSIIVPSEGNSPLTNIDRFYVRDHGQEFGLLKVYRLTPKADHFFE